MFVPPEKTVRVMEGWKKLFDGGEPEGNGVVCMGSVGQKKNSGWIPKKLTIVPSGWGKLSNYHYRSLQDLVVRRSQIS